MTVVSVKTRPHVTVVVLNWNGLEHLKVCLPSLGAQTYSNFTAVVVDNGSTDGSQDFVRLAFPDLRLVELGENRGFSGGNNVVLAELASPYYALLNNDTEVSAQWLEALVNALETRPDCGAAASRMMSYDNRQIIDNCGFTVSVAGTTYELGRSEPFGPRYACAREVFGACAGACLYRTSMLKEVGLFDESFFVIYEDVDLSFRMQRSGWRAVYVPEAVVYHKLHGSMRSLRAHQVYYSQRNVELLWVKNMPAALVLRYGHLRILYSIGSLLYFTFAGALGPYFRAKFDALRGLRAVLRLRRAERARSRIPVRQFASRLEKRVLGPKVKKWLRVREERRVFRLS